MDGVKIGGLISRNFPHHLHNIGGNSNMNVKTLNGVNTKTPNDKITNGKVGNGESADFFEESHVQTSANVVHATGGQDRTRRRKHMFLSLVVSRMLEHI